MPLATSPSPLSSVRPRRSSGPSSIARDVLEQNRRTAVVLEHDLSQIGNAFQVAAAAHHEFKFGQLHRAAAEIHVAGTDRAAHLGQRNIEAAQALRIDHHVVLLDEAADAGDLGDALRLGEAVAERPVLQRAQFGERSLLGDQRIFVDPADAGGIGTEARRHAARQPARRGVEIFEHARARPIDVGAVLEDHVDEGNAEIGEAAHHARLRHREHCRGQWIGDLILDHLRRLTRILRVDDDLRVGEIGQGIERRMQNRIDAGDDHERGSDQHQHQVARRRADDSFDHCAAPALVSDCSADLRLLSASIRKFAEVTTFSRSFKPSRISTYPAPCRPS